MTTIIEQMAKAYWMASEFAIWEDMHPVGRERAVNSMRAALTVLAESDLPEEFTVNWNGDAYDPDQLDRAMFQQIIRAIIEEQSS